MKRILNFVIALFICGNLFSQTPLSYRFRKPTVVNSTTWKFSSVASGIDAIVSITGSKNASVDKIDDSARYAYAWNPFIKYTNSMSKSTDSSYVEFLVEFKKSSGGAASVQNKLAMTIIDCDGGSGYKEMVKVSQTATGMLTTGSLLTFASDAKWLTAIGTNSTTSGLDTSLYKYMAQINYASVSSYKIRVGVLGSVAAGKVRQSSFYFKGFTAMVVALPVELISFSAKSESNTSEIAWTTVTEDNLNRFEVCRSVNGLDFFPIGVVNATANSNEVTNYNFTDNTISTADAAVVYYRLKMVDNNGKYVWSNITTVKTNGSAKATTVTVYPNPTADFVNVNMNAETEAGQISIVDAFGKAVQTEMNQMNNSVQFDVRNLQNGIYFVQILNNDGGTTSSKFIKR